MEVTLTSMKTGCDFEGGFKFMEDYDDEECFIRELKWNPREGVSKKGLAQRWAMCSSLGTFLVQKRTLR